MAFAGEATAGNAEEEEETNQGGIDFSRPFKAMEAPPKPIDYRLWIAGFAIFFFLFRDIIVRELVYWLKFAVLGLDFLINKVIMVLYTLLKPLVPLAAVVTTGTAWATVIVKEAYAFIFNMTSVQAFTEAIVLSSAVLGIGEATKANAVSSQPYTIGLAGCLGLGAVLGFFPSSIFVALLLALVSFSLMVKKKDMVSSVMPVAAVLAAVAEPWVRAFAMASFLALAIHQNWKSPEKEQVPLDNGLSCSWY
ncbi:hypothetical protein SUGI_0632000 [Cryptomeria japonica]|nr:hypothetical protein SUGI_0632000 [Cryptomeria japonica]